LQELQFLIVSRLFDSAQERLSSVWQRVKFKKAVESLCLNVEAVEARVYNCGYDSKIKEQNAEE